MANIVKKPSNNAYKKGKLSKNARFSPRRIKWTPIIIISCILITFIFAMILGNSLGKKADNLQNSTTEKNNVSSITPPSTDRVSPKKELHAYFADLKTASPDTDISLSVITGEPRESGNALFINLKNENGELIYYSDKADELGFNHQDNLALSRIKNHFDYYSDFAVCLFESEFSARLEEEKALKLQTNEILILKEATDYAFDQIIIKFSESITKNNLIYYQAYLLNLKLTCSQVPIGVVLSGDFLNNPDNAGSVAGLLDIVDFFVIDFGDRSEDEIKLILDPIIYFTSRYNCVAMLSDTNEATIEERITALEDKGIENYIVK